MNIKCQTHDEKHLEEVEKLRAKVASLEEKLLLTAPLAESNVHVIEKMTIGLNSTQVFRHLECLHL